MVYHKTDRSSKLGRVPHDGERPKRLNQGQRIVAEDVVDVDIRPKREKDHDQNRLLTLIEAMSILHRTTDILTNKIY